jgi:UDP-N-acetylglucosamine 1-carboxyvinyltransferase
MTMAAATNGNVLIKNVIPKHLEAISSKLNEIGATVIEYDDAVRVMADGRLKATQIKTLPYPGFPTDMQPQMAVTLALSQGTSIIIESIFENRFKYISELGRMGAKVRVEGNSAIITGVEQFTGANMVAPDLRAGAALVIAALSANGFSTVEDIKYILRGYEDFDGKIRSLGGMIELVDSDREVQKFKLRVG